MSARVGAGRATLDELLAAREMLVVAGSGGVGKTTVSAALAVAAAVGQDARVLVLTVDPARRLADALGVGPLGSEPSEVPAEVLAAAAGGPPAGRLWAAMLDTRSGWEQLIMRHAPDARTRDAVLANQLFRNLTSRFVHSHDYLAMEELHRLHESGHYDLIVVDTPPSRNALALLDAPARMREFFGSRLLRWLTVPYRSRILSAASRPFTQIADRALGSRFLEDIAEFFVLFQTMEPTFVRHADEVEALLSDLRTAFVVVTTLEAAPVHEAIHLCRELRRRGYPLEVIAANRVLAPAIRGRAAAASARRLADAAIPGGDLPTAVAHRLDVDAEVAAAVLAEVAHRFDDISRLAVREAERRSELADLAPLVLTAPPLDHDVNDLGDLLEVAAHLRAGGR